MDADTRVTPANSVAAGSDQPGPRCRFCGSTHLKTFVDLGMSPLCESFVPAEKVNAMEAFYPLHALVCQECLLVQLEAYVSASEIFSEYAYFSSFADSWVAHVGRYAEHMIADFGIDQNSFVVEVASNDGYLLQHFVNRGIPVLGVEPAANVAKVAVEKGIPSEVVFFGRASAEARQFHDAAEDVIAFLEIESHREAIVGRLPYGLQKRVELARALVSRPRLLLLDEPMAGMNQDEKREIARFIIDINRDFGTTVILIEHDIGVVMGISDHVVVLDYGRKIGDGAPQDIRNNPDVIAAYLGTRH